VERISVFVVDRARNSLRALIAQEMEGEEFSVPMGVGVVGTVASTGEILDSVDAYADPRFARQFDRKSGYYTNDLFALPVFNREGEIVGVIELLNRLRPITPSDREFLLGISVYIGLALENSSLQMLAKELRESDRKAEAAPDTNDPLTFAGYPNCTERARFARQCGATCRKFAKAQGNNRISPVRDFRRRDKADPDHLGDALREPASNRQIDATTSNHADRKPRPRSATRLESGWSFRS
jgi:hypothetical protein